MKTALWLVASLLISTAASAASPSSINNDDSCDITVAPAATLLLPYFEVDVSGNSGRTTLFTIMNVTSAPQIAHVTLWTDHGYPMLVFNLFLTGYDVQSINLADVLQRSVIAPPRGTTSATAPGVFSASSNPNFTARPDCNTNPGSIPGGLATVLRSVFTTGDYNSGSGANGCAFAGESHANAIGYATIDVVSNCTNRMPNDPLYYTEDLLFDNVLVGDYQNLGSQPADQGIARAGFDGAGNHMVHIRAVPEGGGAGSDVGTNLPYTFYDRYTPAGHRTFDRRQPLPSTFAARYIQGGPWSYGTNFTIWREGFGSGDCTSARASANLAIAEIVRFDEHENAYIPLGCFCPTPQPVLPLTSSTATSFAGVYTGIYPPMIGVDVGGWMYLNLDDGGSTSYSVTSHPSGTTLNGGTSLGNPRASQNWVTITMFGTAGDSRMTAEFDASWLGNGCSPAKPVALNFGGSIGPIGGIYVCPPGTTMTNGTTAQCTGTNVNPTP